MPAGDVVQQTRPRPVLVLCSSSPRRRAILRQLGIRCEVREPAGVLETGRGRPEEVVLANARRKALWVRARERGINKTYVGVDTIVVLGRRILAKPSTRTRAREMIDMLSGRTHAVYSGVHVIGPTGRGSARVAITRVTFRKLSPREIDWYVGTREGADKAGGYAIQGRGAALVRSIRGCYLNVVGFPIVAFREAMTALGIDVADLLKGGAA